MATTPVFFSDVVEYKGNKIMSGLEAFLYLGGGKKVTIGKYYGALTKIENDYKIGLGALIAKVSMYIFFSILPLLALAFLHLYREWTIDDHVDAARKIVNDTDRFPYDHREFGIASFETHFCNEK